MIDEPPEGWANVSLSAVTESVPSVNPSAKPTRIFGYVDISSIDNHRFEVISAELKRFLGKDAPSRARRPIRPGDVLFSNVRTYLRNIALVRDEHADLCSTGFTVLRPTAGIDSLYLLRQVLTNAFIDAVTPHQTGTHYPATSDRVVQSQTIPLPPLAEQRRIVARVEALLAEVNAARDRLAKVPAILKRFRESVLSAAFCGRLTEDWRRARPEVVSPSVPAENRSKGAFALETEAELQVLPSSWVYVPIGNLASFQQGMQIAKAIRFREPAARRLPILRIGNYATGFKEDVDYVETDCDSLIADPDDIILARTGETRGKVLTGHRGVFHNNTFRLNYDQRALVRKFLLYWLQSRDVQEYITHRSGRSAQPDLTHKAFGPCPLPLAHPDEQQEVVRRVDALFTLADTVEEQVAAATASADRITQAVLTKAFRGELVPTEAELARQEGRDYESADALLARIRNTAAPISNGKRTTKAPSAREARARSRPSAERRE